MNLRLDGRLALVTGAGRGIGRASALALAAAGADVAVLSRSAADLEELAEEIGGSAVVLPCDVTDSEALRAAVAGLPRLDVLVACAGANVPEPLADVSDDHLVALLDLNVRSVFVTVQAAARAMTGGGSIVLLSSQMGHVGAAERTVYCATKHAVEGLTKAAAIELAPRAIRVNAVAPTFVETPMTAPFFAEPAFRASVEARIPLGRIGRVEDVSGAVVFLASDAAALMTGSSLLVDGGWTAQ